MKKKIIICLVVIFLIGITIAGITFLKNNGVNNDLISYEWVDAVGGKRTLAFNKDGSGKYINYDMKYFVNGNSINISFESYNQKQSLNFEFIKDNNISKIISEKGEAIYIIKNDKFEENQKAIRTQLVNDTEMLNMDNLWLDISNNEANAKLKYDAKLYKVKVSVMNISTDYFEYSARNSAGYIRSIKVYMPTDELAKLNNDMHITVLGQLNNVTSSPTLYNAFIVDNYTTAKSFDDGELKQKIEQFGGTGGDGKVSWTEGSYPYFINNRDNFEKIAGRDFFNELSGTWKAKYYIEDKKEYKITFKTDSTADYSEYDSDKINEWKYKIVDDTLYFPASRDTKFEVRKASENVIIFYTYTIDYVPYWILYKE